MSNHLDIPKVVAIFVAPEAGAPMEPRDMVVARQGRDGRSGGLDGDRYDRGAGAFSKSRLEVARDVTIISREAIQAASQVLGAPFDESKTRRNIVTEGLDPNWLVGVRFNVGSVALEGVELAVPCDRPSKLAGIPGFREAFRAAGGLRARVVGDGEIRVGDAITFVQDPMDDVLAELATDRGVDPVVATSRARRIMAGLNIAAAYGQPLILRSPDYEFEQ